MLNRRQFVSSLSAATASITLGRAAGAASPTKESDRLGELLPTRRFGPTGEQLTVLGLGGGHLGKQSPREAQESIETCLEGGVRFFDNAEVYEKGLSEEYYGRFLTPTYRDTIYLLTKTTARDAKTARRHLEGSLRRMKTDHIDSYNMHSVTSADDVDERLDKGVLDVLLEAREKGRVRHIGFTGHATPEAHRRMLERTKVLQSCLMPINVVDPHYKSFIRNVLPKVVEREMGVLAMKSGALGNIYKKGIVPQRVSLSELHYFVWSLPVCSLLIGFDNVQHIKDKIRLARSMEPMGVRQREQLIAKVADLAGPEVEAYKEKA